MTVDPKFEGRTFLGDLILVFLFWTLAYNCGAHLCVLGSQINRGVERKGVKEAGTFLKMK